MTEASFTVSLRFFTQTIDPAEICAEIGWEAKIKQKRGNPRVTPVGGVLEGLFEISYCVFELPRQDSENLPELLERVADSMIPHKRLLEAVRDDGGRCEFFVGWFSPASSGVTLGYKLLNKIGNMQIDVDFDMYGSA